jgi:hypothetical protein
MAAMRTAARLLVVGWLLAALAVLGMDGRLLVLVAWAAPASLLGLGIGALIRQPRAPAFTDQPALPPRYRVADDLARPLADVVAVAEQEAEWRP